MLEAVECHPDGLVSILLPRVGGSRAGIAFKTQMARRCREDRHRASLTAAADLAQRVCEIKFLTVQWFVWP